MSDETCAHGVKRDGSYCMQCYFYNLVENHRIIQDRNRKQRNKDKAARRKSR